MLPPLLDESERAQEHRPSLPAIRDLFGEHLARPPNKSPQFTFPPPPRSSLFSLVDLGSSLPVDSRPSSPTESQGWASPRSSRSQASSYHGSDHGYGPGPYSPRRHSDASSYSIASPSPASTHDQFLMLRPIQQTRSGRYRDVSGFTIPAWRPTSSSRQAYESHSRARSTSAAIIDEKAYDSHTSLDVASKRRHTIASARVPSPIRFPYRTEPVLKPTAHIPSRPPSSIGPPYPRRLSVANSYPSPSLSTLGLSPVIDEPRGSSASSAPTSGDDVPTERRKSPAKYQCEYCGKRFNRPSSLKIHHNTHTGEKPFACLFPGCGRHFSVMSNMRRHARIHGDMFSQQAREGSEEISDLPSPAYSSASSTHPTSNFSHATQSSAYSRSYTSSASPSPRLHPLSHLSSSRYERRKRNSAVQRSHPYSPPSSDDESSLPER